MLPTQTRDDDERLIERLGAGDAEALGALYDRYGHRAYRLARAECRDEASAQAAVQDAFAAIWRSQATHRPHEGTAVAWLLTVVRHHAVALARTGDGAPAGQPDDVFRRLPEPQREAIALAWHGELTHAEIARQLRLPPHTVKSRLRHGLHALREDLDRASA